MKQKSLGKNTYCDNVTERIQELAPDFNEHHKLLKQFMIKPFQEVDNDILECLEELAS
jgi:hypothetical protein